MSALADLAAMPRWVAWRNEHGRKVPHDPLSAPGQYRYAKSNDPTTWGTRDAAEVCAERIVNGFGGGVGIELGELGDGYALVGIDVDTCRDPEGGLTDWAQDVVARFDSYTEVSPSGTGVKVFFLLRAEDREALLTEMRAPGENREGKKWSLSSVGDHPPAIEIYLGLRYFTLTERVEAGMPAELRLVEADTVRWLIREAGPALVARGHATASDEGAGAANGRDNSRSAVAFRKGLLLRRGGANYDEMVAGLRADPETAEWVREKGEGDGGRELRRIWDHPLTAPAFSDDALALTFAEHFGEDLRHVAAWGRWMMWSGGVWRHDDTLRSFDLSRTVCREEAAKDGAGRAVASARAVAAVVSLSRADRRIAATVDQWDADSMVIMTGEAR